MIALALATVFTAGPMIVLQAPAPKNAARTVRIEMRINGYGINGSAQMVLDRRDGRFVQHLDLGPASQTIGFDGKHTWFADATGLPIEEGNVDQRSAIVAWSALFSKARPAEIVGSQLRYSGLSRLVTLSIDPETHLVVKAVVPRGDHEMLITPADYRQGPDGLIVPYALSYTDDNGTWSGVVTRVDASFMPAPNSFAPPPKPDDTRISDGTTRVPFVSGSSLIIIPARINNGPVMHFILDSGGQNILTPTALRRLGIRAVGGGTVGGGGANLAPIRFASISSVRVGGAEMRNQPFMILDFGKLLQGIDGILGYELLSRFAARIDYRTDTLQLAAALPSSWTAGARATSFVFRERQPQVSGVIDGIPAAMTIDTGSTSTFDINTPFAREHELWKRYKAEMSSKVGFVGVGGGIKIAPISVSSLRIGNLTLSNVDATLTKASAGFESDPSFAANVGEGVFRCSTLILDYAHQRIFFAPGGLQDRSGMTLAARGHGIVVTAVRRGSPVAQSGVLAGMWLSRLNGAAVAANDLVWVRAQLRGTPGSQVTLTFNGSKRKKIFLRNYL